jgi:hypothetical protein
VSTNFKCIKTQDVFTNGVHSVSNAVKDLLGGNQAKGPIDSLIGANGGVVVGAGKGTNASHDGGPCDDRAKGAVTGAVHGDGHIVFIILLIFEGDQGAISQMKSRVTVVEGKSVAEEADVPECKELGAAFSRVGNLAVLA